MAIRMWCLCTTCLQDIFIACSSRDSFLFLTKHVEILAAKWVYLLFGSRPRGEEICRKGEVRLQQHLFHPARVTIVNQPLGNTVVRGDALLIQGLEMQSIEGLEMPCLTPDDSFSTIKGQNQSFIINIEIAVVKWTPTSTIPVVYARQGRELHTFAIAVAPLPLPQGRRWSSRSPSLGKLKNE